MKILVIEDSRSFRIAIERLLTRAGHSVTAVADGCEGLQAARTSPPCAHSLGSDASRTRRHGCAEGIEARRINRANSRYRVDSAVPDE